MSWNTAYLQPVRQTLRALGLEVHDEDLSHLSPARYEQHQPLGQVRLFQPGGVQTQRTAQPAKAPSRLGVVLSSCYRKKA